MTRTSLISLLLFLAGFVTTAKAQDHTKNKSDLSALFFGDYYWFISNHNKELEGNNGFWVRRIYLTYDHQISESFSGRIRLEIASKGDFLTNSALVPKVKDAWLKWTNGRHQIVAGIAPTPTLELIEEIWRYRSVAKTPLDLQGIGSSRGLGISFKGKIGETRKLGYHFMMANGNGSSTELNKGKKFMLALSYELNKTLVVQAYGDYETKKRSQYIYTAQGFIGYHSPALNFGALFAHQFQNAIISGDDIQLNIASLFTNFDISGKLRGYLRLDHTFEPNPTGAEIEYIPFSNKAKSTFLVGGVDVQLHPRVHLLPNVEAVLYGKNKKGISPDPDLIARLILFFQL